MQYSSVRIKEEGGYVSVDIHRRIWDTSFNWEVADMHGDC